MLFGTLQTITSLHLQGDFKKLLNTYPVQSGIKQETHKILLGHPERHSDVSKCIPGERQIVVRLADEQ